MILGFLMMLVVVAVPGCLVFGGEVARVCIFC